MRRAQILLLTTGLPLFASISPNLPVPRLSFEPNHGQANPSVKFVAHSGGREIVLTNSGVVLSGVELTFSGGKCTAISGLQALAERDNYFLDRKAFTDIPTYARVRCRQLYPGIDVEFYGARGSLEYDLIVAPHSDPSRVSLRWNHVKELQIDRNGDLLVQTFSGVLRQRRPVAYQDSSGGRKSIAAQYVRTGKNEARLFLGAYDKDVPLIIDPVLFASDANASPAGPIAVDSAGNVYLAGSTQTNSFEATAGSVQPVFGGGTCEVQVGTFPPYYVPCADAYVIKVNPSGSVVYATYLGGDGNDIASSIAVDSSGDVYIAGTTSPNSSDSDNFPTTPGAAFAKPSPDGVNSFVAKLNPAGNSLIYATLIPDLYQVTLAIDSQGSAYVAGIASSSSATAGYTGFPTTAGAFQTTSKVMAPATGGVAKLSPSGSALVYATFLSGRDSDGATGIAVDGQGDAYITGFSVSPDFPTTPGAFNTTPPTSSGSVYVTKLNPAGSNLIYSTFLGPGGIDAASTIKIDAQGNAYIVGNTNSSDFPVTPGAFQAGELSAPWAIGYFPGQFLSALNASGSALIYSTFLTGAMSLDVDAAGDAYVVGVAGYNFPVSSGAFQRCVINGTGDLFVIEFNPGGQSIAATYLGGTGSVTPSGIAAGSNGSAYIAGTTSSIDFPGIIGAESGVSLTFVTEIQINNPQATDAPCISQALQNSASFVEGAVAAGELVTIRGGGIGPMNGISGEPGSDGAFPTQLAGIEVYFDGFLAPLLYVQAQQINAVVPWEVGMDYNAVMNHGTQVSVEVNGVPTNTFMNPVVAAAPGIFVVNSANQAAALNQDGSLNSPMNPAAPGSTVAIYGTGGGPTNPAGQTGFLSPLMLAPLTYPVTAQIFGANAQVTYAGAAPGLISGAFQINIVIPKTTPAGNWPVTVTIAWSPFSSIVSSPGQAVVAVQ